MYKIKVNSCNQNNRCIFKKWIRNAMTPLYFNELVRDKIIQHMRNSNATVYTKTLSQEEYVEKLKNRLFEDVEETCATDTKDELLAKLADLQEIIYALAHAMDITLEEVEAKCLNNLQERGTFSIQGMVAKITLPDNHEWIPKLEMPPHRGCCKPGE